MNDQPNISSTATNAVSERPYLGWHLCAFIDDLTGDVSAVDIGTHRLMAVRDDAGVRVFDATCPHRGAHLGHGARMRGGDQVECPFHGRLIRLGVGSEIDACAVVEHQAILAGEALFVRLDGGPDLGFASALSDVLRTHTVKSGFRLEIPVEGSIVIENAFDADHFTSVHDVTDVAEMKPFLGPSGEFVVDSTLNTPGSAAWEGLAPGESFYSFYARAFSPSLVLTRVGPDERAPYFFTGTTPTSNGCVARVAVAIPEREDGREQSPFYVAGLVAGSMEAFRFDTPVWKHLARGFVPRYDEERDRAVIAFREFVDGFRQG